MTASPSTRRVYSAEELFSLRSKASQARFKDLLDIKDDEDAELVKAMTASRFDISPAAFQNHKQWVDELVADAPSPSEHLLLRNSRSFAARSWKSRTSAHPLRVPSNKENRSTHVSDSACLVSEDCAAHGVAVLGDLAPNNQRLLRPASLPHDASPSASLKRKKVEAIVKAHGSPTHIRVTAGGRIVPSEQSPLCQPRYGWSAIKVNGGLIKFAANHPHGKAQQWTQATQNGFVAQDVHGRLCQIVDGTILPLTEVDGALQLFMPAPNLKVTQSAGAAPFGQRGTQNRQTSRIIPPEPSASSQVSALELEYSRLEHDLRDIDKTEALHGRTMNKAAKDALITRRRELILGMDDIRKALKSLKQEAQPKLSTTPPVFREQQSASPPCNRRQPALPQHVQQPSQTNVPPPPMPPAAIYPAFYEAAAQASFAPAYAFQPPTSPDPAFVGQHWMMPPPVFMPPAFDGSLSSTSLPYPAAYSTPLPVEQPQQPRAPSETRKLNADAHVSSEQHLPQSDGANCSSDMRKFSPPCQIGAVETKAPGSALKSSLNPMSPVYNPSSSIAHDRQPVARSVKDRIPTPLLPPQQLLPAEHKPYRMATSSHETFNKSQNWRNKHVHSSSTSSFATADFFPRNTREYSTRKDTYPPSADEDEKENVDPRRKDSGTVMALTPSQGSNGVACVRDELSSLPSALPVAFQAPNPPPSTPVNLVTFPKSGQESMNFEDVPWDCQSHGFADDLVKNRETQNLSPKSKRQEWMFVREDPSQLLAAVSPPEEAHSCQDEICVTCSPYDTLDFSDKSRGWLEGFQAGLGRHIIAADRGGEFLEGYCAGLLKTKPVVEKRTTSSPTKPVSRHPSSVLPHTQATSGLQVDRSRPASACRLGLAPLEISAQSADTLKQAVFAPQNEDAVLTPHPHDPHIDGSTSCLSASEKKHAFASGVDGSTYGLREVGWPSGSPFPTCAPAFTSAHGQQQLSVNQFDTTNETLRMARGGDGSEASNAPLLTGRRSVNEQISMHQSSVKKSLASPALAVASLAPSSSKSDKQPSDARVSSITSVASKFSCPQRILSPLNFEHWKSATSVAHAGGLMAAGLFAHGQFDGSSSTTQPPDSVHRSRPPQTTHFERRIFSDQPTASRFREDATTLDRISPAMSPVDSPSPFPPLTGSPAPLRPASEAATKTSPLRRTMTQHKAGSATPSPPKGASPARAKFEHIAERVGIKVAGTGMCKEPRTGTEPISPSKRRWKDVWRGGVGKKLD